MTHLFGIVSLAFLSLIHLHSSLQDVPKYQDLMNKGQAAIVGKRWSDAVEAYEKAIRLPAEVASKRDRTEATLKAAMAIESWHVHDKAGAPDIGKAVEKYAAVLTQGDDEQRIKAANNLGVYHCGTKDFESAIGAFEKGLPSLKDGPDATIFRYNYARALEGGGKFDNAFKQYLSSYNSDPKFLPPVEGAERIAFDPDHGTISLAAALISASLKAKRVQTAQAELARAIARWGNERESTILIPQLLDYCGDARTTLKDFDTDPVLLGALRSQQLEGVLVEIRNIYLPSCFKGAESLLFHRVASDHNARLIAVAKYFPIILNLVNQKGLDPRAPTMTRKALSGLLSYLADRFASDGKRRKEDVGGAFANEAAARLMAAWILDLTHVQAALQLSTYLRDYYSVLDPEGSVYADFLEILFDFKGGIYAQGIKLAKRDLEDLYALHRLLGDVLSKRAIPGRGEATTPLFQYKRAIEVENRIRTEFDKSFPVSESLQKAYQAAGGK